MPRAVWNGAVVAQSDVTELVEGNIYFPPGSIKNEYFERSATTTVCGWKGTANYYTLCVNGKRNQDAAWFYADPKSKADNIRGHVAFWKGVTIEATDGQTSHASDETGICELDK